MYLIEALGALVIVLHDRPILVDSEWLGRPAFGHETIAQERTRDLTGAIQAGASFYGHRGDERFVGARELRHYTPRIVHRSTGRNWFDQREGTRKRRWIHARGDEAHDPVRKKSWFLE